MWSEEPACSPVSGRDADFLLPSASTGAVSWAAGLAPEGVAREDLTSPRCLKAMRLYEFANPHNDGVKLHAGAVQREANQTSATLSVLYAACPA